MKDWVLRVFLLAVWLWTLGLSSQTLPLPERPADAPSGMEMIHRLTPLSLADRDEAILRQVLSGNVPNFLRGLCPICLTNTSEGVTNTLTFFATPDYLAVGRDDDYFLVPMSPNTSQRIADALHCTLPTPKMVDEIYAAAEAKLAPTPIPPSPAMTSVPVFSNHNAMVWAQRSVLLSAHTLGALVAGHQKDVVICARLSATPGKVAIYGWHQTNGVPIQSLYLGHAATWVDYSQCTRLVQQRMIVNGQDTSVATVLADASLAGLLSDEGVVLVPHYPTNRLDAASPSALPDTGQKAGSGGEEDQDPAPGSNAHTFSESGVFNERVASFTIAPQVRVWVNAPLLASGARKTLLLILYALPNGNTTAQTIGHVLKPGEDWHNDIQHIGAQTRFLRQVLTNYAVVTAYLEAAQKSWPLWRKAYDDKQIPGIVAEVKALFPGQQIETVLSGHSGGGSFIFGYLNAVESIPDDVMRIAFLDSNYAYDPVLGHEQKLARWLRRSDRHCLCVLAYDDASALLNGKSFVSAAGGTWGRSHAMQRDLAEDFAFTNKTNAPFQYFEALQGRVQFILRENPSHEIFHTVQVERNGFIHAMLTGTAFENMGYEYFGPRAYSRWIATE